MTTPLTRRVLDGMPCSNPDCPHIDCSELTMHSRCHWNSGSWVTYDKRRGVLVLACAKCKKPICEIAVATRSWDGVVQ